MNCRSVILLFVLLAVPTGLMVHRHFRDAARRTRARADMEEMKVGVDGLRFQTIFPSLPESLVDLRRTRPLTQARADACIDLGDDPWGHPYVLTIDGPESFTIASFGADGAPGGTGADEDIVLHWPPPGDPASR